MMVEHHCLNGHKWQSEDDWLSRQRPHLCPTCGISAEYTYSEEAKAKYAMSHKPGLASRVAASLRKFWDILSLRQNGAERRQRQAEKDLKGQQSRAEKDLKEYQDRLREANRPKSDEEQRIIFLQCLSKLTIAIPPTTFYPKTRGEKQVVLSGASSEDVISFVKSLLRGGTFRLGDVYLDDCGYLLPIFDGHYARIKVPSGQSAEQSARNAENAMKGNMYSDSHRDVYIFRQGIDSFTCVRHDYSVTTKAEW